MAGYFLKILLIFSLAVKDHDANTIESFFNEAAREFKAELQQNQIRQLSRLKRQTSSLDSLGS